MSKNVEVVKQAYAAFAKGDVGTVLALLDPDVAWVESDAAGIPTRGTHRGPAAVAEKVFATIPKTWQSFHIGTERFLDAGDHVVVTGTVDAVATSGKKLRSPFAHVFSMANGKVTRLENYHDTALWLEALVS